MPLGDNFLESICAVFLYGFPANLFFDASSHIALQDMIISNFAETTSDIRFKSSSLSIKTGPIVYSICRRVFDLYASRIFSNTRSA